MANLNESSVKDILRVYGKIKATEIYSKLIGNADTATKFSGSKTISLAGDATGSVSTDFGTNPTINVTVVDDGHNHTFGTLTGTNPVSKGGTGRGGISLDAMLFGAGTDLYSEIPTTSFGRNLLNATLGGLVTQLNSDMVDGKHVDDSQITSSYLWTANKVKTYVDSLLSSNDAMLFKGTIGSGGTVSAIPTTGYVAGWCYRVITLAIFAEVQCNIGDLVIAVRSYTDPFPETHWIVVPTNVDGAVIGPLNSIDGNIAIFDGATGKVVKDGGKALPVGNLIGDTSYGNIFTAGVVKGSNSVNQISIDSGGLMTVNTIGPTKGGTGLSTIAINSMLYASAADTISQLPTSAFGRSLLNAANGVSIVDLNSDMVDGKHVDDAQISTSYLWTANKIISYVNSCLQSNNAMVFKGTLGVGGTVTSLPTTGYSAGETYRVVTAGTYAGKACNFGDLVICNKDYITAYSDNDWVATSTNSEGAIIGPTTSINGNIAIFDGITGGIIKDSGKSLPAGNLIDDTSYGTSITGGVVKSSSANNQVSIGADGLMTINTMDVEKLNGTLQVSGGGTGRATIGTNAMLYGAGSNAYSSVTTTSFGRSLLSATSGGKFIGLNADLFDGLHLNSSVGMGIPWGYVPKVHTDGIMEVGKTIDFHELSGDNTTDYTYRLTALASGLEGSNRFSAPVLRATQKVNIGDGFEMVYNSSTKSLDIVCLV